MSKPTAPTALVFYHYFHPDDVVSAQHFADLCTGLQDRGWDVTVMPSNRGCRDESIHYPRRETWQNVHIHRVWRPRFRQASTLGRLLNAAWMILAWSFAAIRRRPDALIIGTDPIFSILTAIPWRILSPRTKIFHWCFDLHPEAAVALGMFREHSLPVRMLRPMLRKAYQNCALVGSIGPCMTQRLRSYDQNLPIEIYTPWALAEPPDVIASDPVERLEAFGDARLSLMYSGSFGQAHSYELFLLLARQLKDHEEIRFAYSVRGNRAQELRDAVTPDDTNISFLGFAPQNRLEARLSAADIHMVSLRPGYEGTVVPSKFQGALAAGRPILYAGPVHSAIAKWIDAHGVGWTLTNENLPAVADSLIQLASDPEHRQQLNQTCFDTYHRLFSKASVVDKLNQDMRAVI